MIRLYYCCCCINEPVIFIHCVVLKLGHRFHALLKVCSDRDDTVPLKLTYWWEFDFQKGRCLKVGIEILGKFSEYRITSIEWRGNQRMHGIIRHTKTECHRFVGGEDTIVYLSVNLRGEICQDWITKISTLVFQFINISCIELVISKSFLIICY